MRTSTINISKMLLIAGEVVEAPQNHSYLPPASSSMPSR